MRRSVFKARTRMTRRRFLVGGTGALGAALLGNTLWYEPRSPQVERLTLPQEQAGPRVRLVQVSDLHLKDLSSFYNDVAETIRSLRPDAILLTGDYLEEERNIKGVLAFLERLEAPQGVFAVQGNWEYWSRLEGKNLQRHFAGVGVRLLINERSDFEVGGRPLSVLGLDYPSTANQLYQLQTGLDRSRYSILLSHVPAFAHERLDSGVRLILCGHTHGGQVRLPKLPPLYLPLYSGRFVAGRYTVGPHRTPLYVNRGLGTSVLPMRLLCRPEITLIEI